MRTRTQVAMLSAAVLLPSTLLTSSGARAQEPTDETADQAAPEPPAASESPPGDLEDDAPVDDELAQIDPDEGFARPDEPDLRSGSFIIAVDGGVFVPSAPFAPNVAQLGSLDAGGTVHGMLGVGVDRYLVLFAGAGYTRLPGACDGCAGDSVDASLGLAFHLSQAFALDPWASFGVGYRYSNFSLATADDLSFHGLDFARFGVGADYYPTPWLGLGPYVATDVGFRGFEEPTFYDAFSTGFRFTFDPFRAGTQVAPGSTTETARR